jgi:hypothetical protein
MVGVGGFLSLTEESAEGLSVTDVSNGFYLGIYCVCEGLTDVIIISIDPN